MTDRECILRVTAKDFDVSHVRGSGPGGQHRNKTATGVRMKHRASGAVGEATDNRSQDENKKAAFRRCIATKEFQAWLKTSIAEAMGRPSLASRLEDAMRPENIETQVLEADRWVAVDPSALT